MAVRFTTTASTNKYVKCLVDGASGIGKTRLCATAPKPLIISAESGLLSLQEYKIPVIEVRNHIDLEEAYQFVVADPKAAQFMTICLDSISDIAEACLAWFKENPVDGNTHPQAAYGSMADAVIPLIKKFRDLPNKHVYFTAKIKRETDQYTGIDTFIPSAPGQIIGPGIPYLFDFILPMRLGETESGKKFRYLQTQPDMQYHAKDRSGRLAFMEEPHLGKLFAKALGIPFDPALLPKKVGVAVPPPTAPPIAPPVSPPVSPTPSAPSKEEIKEEEIKEEAKEEAQEAVQDAVQDAIEDSFPGENGEFPGEQPGEQPKA